MAVTIASPLQVAREFREALAQLTSNVYHLDSQRLIAVTQGNVRAIGELSLMQLQCTLASTVLAYRAAAYERCASDVVFAQQFYAKVPTN